MPDYIMQFLATTTSNRDAGVEFSSRGYFYRKLGTWAENKFKAPLPGLTKIAIRGLAYHTLELAESHTTKEYVPIKRFRKVPLNQIAKNIPFEADNATFSCASELSAKEVADHNLVKLLPMPKHPFVYATQKIDPAGAAAIVRALNKPDRKINPNCLARNEGTPIADLAILSRVSRYLDAAFEVAPTETSDANYHQEVIEDVQVDIDDTKPVTYDSANDRMSVPAAYQKKYNLLLGEAHSFVRMSKKTRKIIYKASEIQAKDSGHLFGFFPGCVPNDRTVLIRIIREIASHNLADTQTGCEDEMQKMFDGLSAGAAMHPMMQVMMHQSAVLELAFCLARPVALIYDGTRYMGAFIRTVSDIYYEGRTVKAITGDVLTDALGSLITTETAKDEFVRYLNTLPFRSTVASAQQVAVATGDITSLESIYEAVSKRVTSVAKEEDLPHKVRLATVILGAHFLNIVEPKAPAIVETISNILGGVLPNDGQLSAAVLLTTRTVIVANMSRFGRRSISFRNDGGIRKDIYQDPALDPEPTEQKVITTKARGTKKGLQKKKPQQSEETVLVPFWGTVSLSRPKVMDAVEDWEALLLDKFMLQLDLSKNSGMGITVYKDEDARMIVNALRPIGFSEKPKKKSAYVAPGVVGIEEGEEDEEEFDEDDFAT